MRPVPTCYASGRGISLNRALFQPRPLHHYTISHASITIPGRAIQDVASHPRAPIRKTGYYTIKQKNLINVFVGIGTTINYSIGVPVKQFEEHLKGNYPVHFHAFYTKNRNRTYCT